MSIVGLWSGKNYLKHAVAQPGTMNRPGTADGAGAYFSTTSVSHNLGYVPLVRLAYDPDGDGTIYPAIGQKGASSVSSPGVSFDCFVDDITATAVSIRAEHFGSALAGTFTYYIRIYVDPTL